MASADIYIDTGVLATWVKRAGVAEDKLRRLQAADPDLFDPDESAEDKVYETYGSNGRYLREDFLDIMGNDD